MTKRGAFPIFTLLMRRTHVVRGVKRINHAYIAEKRDFWNVAPAEVSEGSGNSPGNS